MRGVTVTGVSHEFLKGMDKEKYCIKLEIDLFDNPVACLSSPAVFQAKALQNRVFSRKLFGNWRFPNNSNICILGIIKMIPKKILPDGGYHDESGTADTGAG